MGMLLAYTRDGTIVATLDSLVIRDPQGNVVGLADFAAHEAAGRPLTDLWTVNSGDPTNPIKGSKHWPEWLGATAHGYRVELDGPAGQKHIAALVHRTSGYRRGRAVIDAAIADANARGVHDLRHLLGDPGHPLAVDAEGRTSPAVTPEPAPPTIRQAASTMTGFGPPPAAACPQRRRRAGGKVS